MDDKTFELLTEMYADLTSRLDNIDKKMENKADKSDIVLLENKLDNNSKALFDYFYQQGFFV